MMAAAKPVRFSLAPARYSAPAMAFHWLLALLIALQFSFGVYMADLPFSPGRIQQFNWHKWAGITILALSALRLLWRLVRWPPPAVVMPAWQARLAHATHLLLYFLFFCIPLVGWAYSSSAGFSVVYFGIWPLPDWVGKDADLASQRTLRHQSLAYTLAALVALHVAGAFKHHFIDRDGLLRRMNPFTR